MSNPDDLDDGLLYDYNSGEEQADVLNGSDVEAEKESTTKDESKEDSPIPVSKKRSTADSEKSGEDAAPMSKRQ